MNLVILEGFVGQEPKLIITRLGGEIVKFSLATTEKWKIKGTEEQKSRTEWHNVTVLEKTLVDYAKTNIKKGSLVYVEGQIHSSEWTDGNDVKRKSFDINVASPMRHKLQLKQPNKGEERVESSYINNNDLINKSQSNIFAEDDFIPF